LSDRFASCLVTTWTHATSRGRGLHASTPAPAPIPAQDESQTRGRAFAFALADRRFSEAAFVKYGVRRLSLLVQYGKRFRREWAGGELDQMRMRVPGEDGYLREKPFPECTPEEVGRALSSDGSKESISVPRLDEYCIHLLREGVRKRFAEDSSASINAFVREGRMHVTLKKVSVTELKMLAHAILESTAPLDQGTDMGGSMLDAFVCVVQLELLVVDDQQTHGPEPSRRMPVCARDVSRLACRGRCPFRTGCGGYC
jgi:hypothetical protein